MPDAGTLVLVALYALLVAGALAPLETLGWWAGWFGESVDPAEARPLPARHDDPEDDGHHGPSAHAHRVDPWVVFLNGIHAVGPVPREADDARLVNGLRRALPEGRVVQVFPYSVTNRALTGQRTFAWLWRLALSGKRSGRPLGRAAGFVINLRNLWQVLVSADRRYGPMYHRGTAALVLRALARRGYAGGGRVVLVGYSGGGQVAVGAAGFVKEATGAEVTVVSIGGVLAADPGLLDADRVLQLVGSRDRVHRLGALLFPGRWLVIPWSPWNVARRRGTLHEVVLGPCDHTGLDGYLDDQVAAADGRDYLRVTVDVVAAAALGLPPTALPVADPTPVRRRRLEAVPPG